LTQQNTFTQPELLQTKHGLAIETGQPDVDLNPKW